MIYIEELLLYLLIKNFMGPNYWYQKKDTFCIKPAKYKKVVFFLNVSNFGERLKRFNISQKLFFILEYEMLYIHAKFLSKRVTWIKIIKEKTKLRILYNDFNYFYHIFTHFFRSI